MKKILIIFGLVLSAQLCLTNRAFAQSWSYEKPLPFLISSQVSSIINNRVYSFGGSANTGQSRNDTYYSGINPDGSLINWNLDFETLTNSLIWHSGANFKNFQYILGGYEENNGSSHDYVNSVSLGIINSDGNFESWIFQNQLPKRLGLGGSIVLNDRLYYLGGRNNSEANKKVYFAPINNDGTLGTWVDAGELPDELYSMGVVQSHGKIIILGGNNWNNTTFDKVYAATLNNDGTIQSWSTYPSLPKSLSRPGVTVIKDYIVVAGGYSPDGGFQSNVYYAKIQDDGSISSWKTSPASLPRGNCCSPLVSNDNYLYIIGGHDGGYYSEVLMAPFNSVVSEDLAVPLLKQTSLPWAGDIYDSATKWDPSDPSIAIWGCALTSAAMVFNYHNLSKLPDNSNLNPRTLNNWLKSQSDGYIRNGLVNWLALARLSKIAKASGNNTDFQYDALEFSKIYTNDKTLLRADLNNKLPDILELPGHFVVAKGIQNDTFSINDPYASFTTLAQGYNNTFKSLNRFVPSHTDLSYIQIIGDSHLVFSLLDNANNSLGDKFSQEPISNELDSSIKSGEVLQELLLKKPSTDTYNLFVSSAVLSTYSIDIYLYDENGIPFLKTVNGFTDLNNPDSFSLNYNHDNSGLSQFDKIVTYASTINDINEALKLKLIDKGYATSLLSLMKSAQKSKITSQQEGILKAILKTLDLAKGKQIKQGAYEVIKYDTQTLLEQL